MCGPSLTETSLCDAYLYLPTWRSLSIFVHRIYERCRGSRNTDRRAAGWTLLLYVSRLCVLPTEQGCGLRDIPSMTAAFTFRSHQHLVSELYVFLSLRGTSKDWEVWTLVCPFYRNVATRLPDCTVSYKTSLLLKLQLKLFCLRFSEPRADVTPCWLMIYYGRFGRCYHLSV